MPNSESDDDLVIELETLDQWESELDQFAAQIIHRLRNLTVRDGESETSAQPSPRYGANSSGAEENTDAVRLLQSFRELSQ